MSLKDKVAVVVGASLGSGRAYVHALAREGARVVAAARTVSRPDDPDSDETLAAVVKEAAAEGNNVLALGCDVGEESQVRKLVDEVIANYGRIDVLVNAVGIYPRYDVYTMDLDGWDMTIRINARGPYLTMRTVAPYMIAQKSGSIINLTSLTAKPSPKYGGSHIGLCAYGVSKAALERVTLYFAEELKEFGIAVNAISPGFALSQTLRRVDPEMFARMESSGKGNPATPEVLGPPIVYLAQQTAETMTGRILHTNTFRKEWP